MPRYRIEYACVTEVDSESESSALDEFKKNHPERIFIKITLCPNKIVPLNCPICHGTKVTKSKERIFCDDCKKAIKADGTTEEYNLGFYRSGRNPKIDTGDYLEGFIHCGD